MELLIASKRQLKPNSRRRKRNPLALENSKIFDQEIVEKTVNHKATEVCEEPLPIPVQTIKGPRTPAEKNKQPLLTPGSVYRSRIGDKLILKIKLPTTV
ncbi:Oidioi.mRNA.OKI2018_I69.PAR.g9827.t1.cds [Oikopleura dioica]|uniref:Oidioi.mRNA.OKI2018_I69.PAR.g9827.t1.cds n=1 Tax=Oikopleura dioica TaxID=34765 RepID=A0ABN7RMR9_OIKDI|nr:Oidioi.mRNA.OKI2018_I69.PAR.g9827.t1.cds [Oikopleura dioica]